MTDPIADMFSRIRNAYMAKHTQVLVPHSQIKFHLAQKLEKLGYLKEVSIDQTDSSRKTINIKLSYSGKQPAITHIKKISRPGRKTYIRKSHLSPTLSGFGSTILSTSQGILTSQEALTKGIGGEIICQVW